jgi:hypothetical protein
MSKKDKKSENVGFHEVKKSKETLKYVVTLQREVVQLQETKIIIEVPPEEVDDELGGWNPSDYAEDQALKIAGETDEEYEDEKGNVIQDNARSSKVNWVNVGSKDPEDRIHEPQVIAVRKFRPSQQ